MANNIMMMGEESTIRGYIENYGTDEMTHDSLYFQQVVEDKTGKKIIVNGDSLLLRYMNEIKVLKQKHEFTEVEYRKYKYNPKRLSYDLYGTTELWSLILDINEVTSVAQFDMRTIWILPPYLVERIQRIHNLENENRNYNAEEVSADLNS